ncbi:acyl carrier protein [Plantactinospora sp. ZYX-F-223]|uniref:acyl carrier protein n=1 Tax=Plantactinospora sp. ZYX-F-223 TaxID=3144103 RepID=UPI0031FC722D
MIHNEDAASHDLPGGVETAGPGKSAIEETVLAALASVLEADAVGLNENLFDLGANSAQVAAIVRNLRESVHPDLPLRLLFMAPTVAGMAHEIELFLWSQRTLVADMAEGEREDGEI